MRTPVRKALLGLTAVFVVIQVWQPQRTNPPADPELAIERHVPVPADVKAILDRSCRDCHSHETRWPFYAYIAPFSWDLASHVRDAREEMNLSEWGDYDAESMQEILDEMCEQVRDGNMPLPQYALFHWSARLSPSDVDRFCAWTTKASAAVAETAPPAEDGEP